MADWFAKALAIRLWPGSQEKQLHRLLQRWGGYTPEPDLGEEELGHLVRRVRKVRAWPFLRRLHALRAHSWDSEMSELTGPVLVIEGEKEMATLPPGFLDLFRQRENCSVTIVPGGHMPFLTHAAEFVDIVNDFLDRD